MKTEHTLTPWTHNDNGLIYGTVYGDDDEAPFVADVVKDRELAAFGILNGEEKANATFIVRACSAHDVLLEALEFVRMTFADIEASKRKGYYVECPKIVAAAIAKAQGRG